VKKPYFIRGFLLDRYDHEFVVVPPRSRRRAVKVHRGLHVIIKASNYRLECAVFRVHRSFYVHQNMLLMIEVRAVFTFDARIRIPPKTALFSLTAGEVLVGTGVLS